jgi:hypothetical protein
MAANLPERKLAFLEKLVHQIRAGHCKACVELCGAINTDSNSMSESFEDHTLR